MCFVITKIGFSNIIAASVLFSTEGFSNSVIHLHCIVSYREAIGSRSRWMAGDTKHNTDIKDRG